MPGFCLKHIISWESKTLLKAVGNQPSKGYAPKSNWSHRPGQHQDTHAAVHLHVTQCPQSDLRQGLEFALKNPTGVGRRQCSLRNRVLLILLLL